MENKRRNFLKYTALGLTSLNAPSLVSARSLPTFGDNSLIKLSISSYSYWHFKKKNIL